MNRISTAHLFAPVQHQLATVEARLQAAAVGEHHSLTAATQHLLSAGGKRLRPAIVLLTAGIFGPITDRILSLAAAIEMLHLATLVHDDLIDGALFRRGVPTLNADWTPAATILTGDYLFARAASLVAEADSVPVMQLFAQTLMTIVNGELEQNLSKGHPGRQAYFRRIYAKTAALFVLCTQAAATLNHAAESNIAALSRYGRLLGTAFQIMDDVLDYTGAPEKLGKPAGGDLRQGLITLPAIYYCESYPESWVSKALRNGRMGDENQIQKALTAINQSPAIEQARQKAQELVGQAQLALADLPQTPFTTSLLEIADYSVRRKR
jgi:geranylgeranyl pyrophosphate synthase